jgi:hypothetical protein
MPNTTLWYRRSPSDECGVGFVRTELELAFTMLQAAKLTSNREHYHSAIEKIRRALQSVRNFEARLKDPELSKTIHNLADELERALDTPEVAALVVAA